MIKKEDVTVSLRLEGDNKLVISCGELEDCEYAFYIYRDNKRVDYIGYSDNPQHIYWLTLPGTYKVSVFVKPANGERVRKDSSVLEYANASCELPVADSESTGFFKNVGSIWKELVDNWVMSFRIAQYDYQLENRGTYLGKLWSLLTPLIQIGIYWFVFGIGLRQGRDVDGYPFIIWMVCGIIPWFCINSGFLQGAYCIVKKASSLARMKFPLATVPLSSIFVVAFEHLMMMVILIFMLLCKGVYPRLSWLNVIYYMIYMLVFLLSLSMVTSVLTVITRDFYKLLHSFMRLLFYVTPILWRMDNMPETFQKAMEYNPVYYIVKGFRESILYNIPFWIHYDKMLFFWTISILLFLSGANLQVKFRHKFIDLI